MTEQTVIDLGVQTIWTTIKIASPALIATLIIGLIVSIIQAATQIQEQTLSFIPKILGMTAVSVFFGPWILQVMIQFTVGIFSGIPGFVH